MKSFRFFAATVLIWFCFGGVFAQKIPSINPEVALKIAMDRFEPRDGEYISGFSVALKSGAELNNYLRAPVEEHYAQEKLYWSVHLNISSANNSSGYVIGSSIDGETGKPWR